MCGLRCVLQRSAYRRGHITLTHAVKVCHYSCASTGDSSSDGDNIDNTMLPGSAVRAKKSAAKQFAEAKMQEESNAQQSLDDKLTSAVDNIAKSLPSEHQSKTRSELLQKLLEHSVTENSRSTATSFASVFAGMRIDNGQSDVRLSVKKSQPKYEMLPRLHRPPRPHRASVSREIVPGVGRLFEGPSLGIFSSQHKTAEEHREVQSTLFDELEAEDSKRLMSLPPNNAFEEMIRWTQEGKLWTFPIDNEQGLDAESQVGFHEHVFLESLIDDRFPSSGPVRHFMELVTVGLSKSPYLSVAEKHAHIAWYAEYFKDKYELIEQSQAAAAAAATTDVRDEHTSSDVTDT